jgi:hypothetical protein
MEGIGLLIFLCFFFTFGVPIIFFIIWVAKRARGADDSKIFLVMAVGWLIVGGGICASILGVF